MSRQEQTLDALKTNHLQGDLRGRSVRGGFVTLTSQGLQFAIQSISTVIMARLLTPADFGLVAMVSAVTALASAFSDFGLSEATIQREEINHNQVSTLFWINVGIGMILMLVTLALAPVLAWFYREPRLTDITLLFSLTFLISGLRVQHDALLKRQMRFTSLAFRDVGSYALAVPVGIIVAWRGGGYWALIVATLTLNFTQMVVSWLMVRWRPGLPQRDAEVRSLMTFGGNVAGAYVLTNINRNADNVLVGWFWGASPLGLYSRAYNFLMLPVRQLSAPAAAVAVPTFSRIQDTPERFARYYLRLANLIVWIGGPLFGFLFVAAHPVIRLVLGKQWLEAAPVFQILAIGALGQLLFESTIWLFISRGQSGKLFKLLLIVSPLTIAAYGIGLPFGIKGVALCGSLILLVVLPWMLRVAFRGTTLTLGRLGLAILYPVSLSLAAILTAEGGLRAIAPESIFSQLLVAAIGFGLTYSLAALIRPVRAEFRSFRSLLSDLRVSGQSVEPAA